MIDLHSHVLPGIDDGPGRIDGSLQILRAAHEDGIARLAATPHVRADWPTTPGEMEAGVASLQESAHELGVELLPGGELDVDYAETLDDETLRRFGLGGNPSLLLIEFPYVGWPLKLPDFLFRLGVRGFTVVVAHPERNDAVEAEPERLRELGDVYFQLTAAAVDGRLGRRTAETAKALLDAGLAHLIASDAHEAALRRIGLRDAAESVGNRALARWLTVDVPEALLAGQTPPPRPPRRRRLPLRWRH